MQARAVSFPVPGLVCLALFIAVMQVQGSLATVAAAPDSVLRPLTDLGHLGYILLIASGVVIAVRRRSPVAVFAVTAVANLTYYTLDFPDGPGWLGLFVALYTLAACGDGNGARSAVPGRENTGMRERWQLLGGDLDARPIADGGFAVVARLPFAQAGAT